MLLPPLLRPTLLLLLLREGVLMERLGLLELLDEERLGVKVLRGALLLELFPKWRLEELELLVLGRVTVVRVLLWLKLRGVALWVLGLVLGRVLVEGCVVVERPPNERLPC